MNKCFSICRPLLDFQSPEMFLLYIFCENHILSLKIYITSPVVHMRITRTYMLHFKYTFTLKISYHNEMSFTLITSVDGCFLFCFVFC